MIEAELARLGVGWRRFWPAADVGVMVADVGERLGAAVARWGLRDVAVLGGGDVGLVCSALAERPVVLKLHPRGHGEDRFLAAEAVALEAWRSSGAVPELIASADDGLSLLLGRLEPGRALDAVGIGWEERLWILGGLVARLHGTGASPAGVPALEEYGSGWRRDLARDPAILGELEDLLASTNQEVLLHADLHGGNALEHHGSWLAIDPHAVRGDPHADVWALIDPLAPALPADPAAAALAARQAVENYAAAANLDPVRAARWARVRAAAEAASAAARDDVTPADRDWAERLRHFAAALA